VLLLSRGLFNLVFKTLDDFVEAEFVLLGVLAETCEIALERRIGQGRVERVQHGGQFGEGDRAGIVGIEL
jgi:hypothetical protein